MKTCKRCGQPKPDDAYSRTGRGVLHTCRDCMATLKKEGMARARARRDQEPLPAEPAPAVNDPCRYGVVGPQGEPQQGLFLVIPLPATHSAERDAVRAYASAIRDQQPQLARTLVEHLYPRPSGPTGTTDPAETAGRATGPNRRAS
jgi:hypothetical protein